MRNYLEYLSQPDTQMGLFITNILAATLTALLIWG